MCLCTHSALCVHIRVACIYVCVYMACREETTQSMAYTYTHGPHTHTRLLTHVCILSTHTPLVSFINILMNVFISVSTYLLFQGHAGGVSFPRVQVAAELRLPAAPTAAVLVYPCVSVRIYLCTCWPQCAASRLMGEFRSQIKA